MNRLTNRFIYIALTFAMLVCQCNKTAQKKEKAQTEDSFEQKTLAIMLEEMDRSHRNLEALQKQAKKLLQEMAVFEVEYQKLQKLLKLMDEIERLEKQYELALKLDDKVLAQKLEALLDILHKKANLTLKRLSQPSIKLPKIWRKPNWPTPPADNSDSEFPSQRPA